MISKIKGLMDAKEDIDELAKGMKDQKKAYLEMKTAFEQLSQEFKEFTKDVKEEQKQMMKEVKQGLGKVTELNRDYEKEIHEFKLRKTQTTKKLLERGNDDLNEHFEKLRYSLDEYNKLKTEIKQISSKILETSTEIDKFNKIAATIKEKDYDLSRFAKTIFEADKEKLELMRKIDTMERLVAKTRRTH